MIAGMDAPPTEPVTDAAPPPHTEPSKPRLTRRLDGRLLGGVAGGAADALGVDVVFVRLGFVVATFFGGLGVLVYLVAWLLLPVAPATDASPPRGDRRQLVGYGLVALGLLAVGGRVGWSFRDDGAFWPLVLIGLGAAVLWLRSRDDRDGGGRGVPPSAPPPAPDHDATTPAPASAAPPSAAPQTEPVTEADTEADNEAATVSMPTRELTPWTPPSAARLTPPRSYLGALTISALLVLVGVAWVLEAADVVDVDLELVAALALLVVGIALLVSAWFGRARGLVVLGLLLAVVVGALGLVDVPLRGGIGDPAHHPRTVAAVERDYALAIGNLSVDLRDVDFAGTARHVNARVGIGQLNVTVPRGVRVVLDAHAGVGGVTAFGDSAHECCPTDVHTMRAGDAGGGTLTLDLDVGAGHVDVTRREESLRVSS
jgi:phage shock protein PspC (stress-responsive transcriptional regulator)